MYTYHRTFIGMPLSQFSKNNEPKKTFDFISELAELVEEDLSINNIEQFLKYANDDNVRLFLKLYSLNIEELEKHNINFFTNYNGGNNQPMIFGKYIDELFPIPIMGIGEVNTDLSKIINEFKKMEEIFRKLIPPNIFEELKEEKLLGVFFNQHSN